MKNLINVIKQKTSNKSTKKTPVEATQIVETRDVIHNEGQPQLDTGHQHEQNETADESEHLKDVVVPDQVVAVMIHKTDRIKSKTYIAHPTVKIHVINSISGDYLRKSVRLRPGSYNIEKPNVDHLLPLMTKPSKFRSDPSADGPTWEEILLFNESYSYFVKPENQVLMIFEVLDYLSMEALKQTTDVEGDSSGWYRIAWAFLKIVGATGEVNCGRKLRLQLYRAPRKTRMKDDQQCEVFHWYKNLPKVKYSGSLYVTVKATVPPNHVPKVSRSMFAVQAEGTSDDVNNTTVEAEMEEKIEDIYLWSRLPGQPCKVPNKLMLSLVAGKLGCFSTNFAPNGRLLACAGHDAERKYPVYIFSIPQGLLACQCLGHVDLVYDLKFNLNSSTVLSASADCTARLWDATSGASIQTFPHTTFVYCARFHPANENIILTGAFDKKIRVWQIVEGVDAQIIQELENHAGYVNSMCFSIDGLTLYSGDGSGYIRIWDTPLTSTGHWALRKELKEDELLRKPINNLIVHPDQKRLFVQSRDGIIRVLELRAYALRQRFTGFENNHLHIRCAMSPCGTFLFSGCESGKAVVWHIQTGKQVAEYNKLCIGEYPVANVAYHPLDHIVAFAIFGEGQTLSVYKFDSSHTELYKEEVKDPKEDKTSKPAFDPDFSVAKLLEEHKILSKVNIVAFKPKTQPTFVIDDAEKDEEDAKPLEQVPLNMVSKRTVVSSPSKKHVSFKSPSQSPEAMRKNLLMPKPQVTTPQTLMIPSMADEGRQMSMLEKTFSEEDEENGENSQVEPYQSDNQQEPSPTTEIPAPTLQSEGSFDAQSTVLFTVNAKHNYTAQNDDEISFAKDTVINVVSNEDPNWWVGFMGDGKVGYFPSNFVYRNEAVIENETAVEEI